MFYQAVVTLYQLTQHNIPEGKTSTTVLWEPQISYFNL